MGPVGDFLEAGLEEDLFPFTVLSTPGGLIKIPIDDLYQNMMIPTTKVRQLDENPSYLQYAGTYTTQF